MLRQNTSCLWEEGVLVGGRGVRYVSPDLSYKTGRAGEGRAHIIRWDAYYITYAEHASATETENMPPPRKLKTFESAWETENTLPPGKSIVCNGPSIFFAGGRVVNLDIVFSFCFLK